MAVLHPSWVDSVVVSVLFVLATGLVFLLVMMIWTTVGRRFWRWFTTAPTEALRVIQEEVGDAKA